MGHLSVNFFAFAASFVTGSTKLVRDAARTSSRASNARSTFVTLVGLRHPWASPRCPAMHTFQGTLQSRIALYRWAMLWVGQPPPDGATVKMRHSYVLNDRVGSV